MAVQAAEVAVVLADRQLLELVSRVKAITAVKVTA
jgi:hypothetical protein